MNIIYLKRDLSKDQADAIIATGEVAVDTELTGLDVKSDRLCLVQLRGAGSDDFYLVQIQNKNGAEYPNLCRVLTAPNVPKIFHYARMDMCMLFKRLGVFPAPVFCTKIAVLLARPKKGHALHNVLHEVLGIDLDPEMKAETLSDWTRDLTKKQQLYAATDVLYLHDLKRILADMLIDVNRSITAQACFDFLPIRCRLDLDWGERDIFAYNPK